jgi:hypothetical protein
MHEAKQIAKELIGARLSGDTTAAVKPIPLCVMLSGPKWIEWRWPERTTLNPKSPTPA